MVSIVDTKKNDILVKSCFDKNSLHLEYMYLCNKNTYARLLNIFYNMVLYDLLNL